MKRWKLKNWNEIWKWWIIVRLKCSFCSLGGLSHHYDRKLHRQSFVRGIGLQWQLGRCSVSSAVLLLLFGETSWSLRYGILCASQTHASNHILACVSSCSYFNWRVHGCFVGSRYKICWKPLWGIFTNFL